MREELSVPHSIISFENLKDLLSELDHSMETYSKITKRYEDRLGVLLRKAKESGDTNMRSSFGEFGSPGAQSDQDLSRRKREEKKPGRRDSDERGWIVLESGDNVLRIANGSDSQLVSNEISILFKVIETLKSKINALEASRRMVSELTAQGFSSEDRLRVVFKDGLPKYIIPAIEQSRQQQRKFKYVEEFKLTVLK